MRCCTNQIAAQGRTTMLLYLANAIFAKFFNRTRTTTIKLERTYR